MTAANSSANGPVYFPSYSQVLDYLQNHASTRDESTEIQQMAARYFDHFPIQQSRSDAQIGNQGQTFKEKEIQKRVNDLIEYELCRSDLPNKKIDDTCTKLKKALGDCLNGKSNE